VLKIEAKLDEAEFKILKKDFLQGRFKLFKRWLENN
jgi:hypothetical protein